MRSSLGLITVFALAIMGAITLSLAQRAYAPPAVDDDIVSAAQRDLYIADDSEGPYGYAPDLPMGETQFLTFKALVVNSEIEHSSSVTPDGTSFRVNAGMQPGDSFEMYVSLNNSSSVTQSAELTVDAPEDMIIDVQTSMGSASAPEVNFVRRNHWTIIYSGDARPGGPFDLSISVYSSKFMSREDGRVQFELQASEYIPQRPQLAGLVY